MITVTVHNERGEPQFYATFSHDVLAVEYQARMQRIYRDAGVRVFVRKHVSEASTARA